MPTTLTLTGQATYEERTLLIEGDDLAAEIAATFAVADEPDLPVHLEVTVRMVDPAPEH